MNKWQDLPWVNSFASFFKISAVDVKLVYEVFLGDRVNSWTHPFGDIAEWVNRWNDEESVAKREQIKKERGWDWNSIGAKILQNEIYRRTPGAVSEYQQLRNIISGYRQRLDRDICLLDYGCGTSNLVDNIISLPGVSYVLFETDPVVVDYCAYKYRNNHNVLSCNLIPSPQVFSGDACRVPTLAIEFEKSFDVIYSMDVLEHTLDPLSILMNLVKHLNNGGLLIFNYPDNIEGDWHTPEANYLRPFCLFYINLLFTQEGPLVYRKTASHLTEKNVNTLAKYFSIISKPFIKKRALKYLQKSPYAKKYLTEAAGWL